MKSGARQQSVCLGGGTLLTKPSEPGPWEKCLRFLAKQGTLLPIPHIHPPTNPNLLTPIPLSYIKQICKHSLKSWNLQCSKSQNYRQTKILFPEVDIATSYYLLKTQQRRPWQLNLDAMVDLCSASGADSSKNWLQCETDISALKQLQMKNWT